jgi:segregation and condensation protein A
MSRDMQSPFQLVPDTLGAAYPIRLPVFEGPLDLLLHLIECEELDITEISLMAVTDQYLQAVENMEEIEPGALADFLVVAARLLYLKSRRLLPQPRPLLEEEEEDPGDALLRQLLEYRRFKAVAAGLRQREEMGLRVFVRVAALPGFERRLDFENVDLQQLCTAVQRALHRIPVTPAVPRVRTYAITVAAQIEVVRQYISRAQNGGSPVPVHFAQLLDQAQDRMAIIVTFLAVLELIKQQEIQAEQGELFGEIILVPHPAARHNNGQVCADL